MWVTVWFRCKVGKVSDGVQGLSFVEISRRVSLLKVSRMSMEVWCNRGPTRIRYSTPFYSEDRRTSRFQSPVCRPSVTVEIVLRQVTRVSCLLPPLFDGLVFVNLVPVHGGSSVPTPPVGSGPSMCSVHLVLSCGTFHVSPLLRPSYRSPV